MSMARIGGWHEDTQGCCCRKASLLSRSLSTEPFDTCDIDYCAAQDTGEGIVSHFETVVFAATTRHYIASFFLNTATLFVLRYDNDRVSDRECPTGSVRQ